MGKGEVCPVEIKSPTDTIILVEQKNYTSCPIWYLPVGVKHLRQRLSGKS